MAYRVVVCPSEEISFNNCINLHPEDVKQFNSHFDPFYTTKTYLDISYKTKNYVFPVQLCNQIKRGTIGLNGLQRRWIGVDVSGTVRASLYAIKDASFITYLTLEIDFLHEDEAIVEPYNVSTMAAGIRSSLMLFPQTIEQESFFKVGDKPRAVIKVKDMEIISEEILSAITVPQSTSTRGIINANTLVRFVPKEGSKMDLTGKPEGKSTLCNIVNADWDFTTMGIGGLNKELSTIFRRTFMSRLFPSQIMEQIGMHHVKGILLHGPPGTGKDLMVDVIRKMFNTLEPTVINGPELLNTYGAEYMEHVHKIYKFAEEDMEKFGMESPLHMIVFDEIDAICKQGYDAGVHDTITNQLLSKIDETEPMSNVFVIGITNRMDLVDEALLRPGRLDVNVEIGLPDVHGRVEILNIHTAKLRISGKLDENVSIDMLASQTENYSGADLQGLVQAACTRAMNRLVEVEGLIIADPNCANNLCFTKNDIGNRIWVTNQDFVLAVENDIKPKFGVDSLEGSHYMAKGIIKYSQPIEDILEKARLLINQTRISKLNTPVTILLEGAEGTGKTALAAYIAYELSKFPYVSICSHEKMIGYSENAKCRELKQIFNDASESKLSCIIIDDIERLFGYSSFGSRICNAVLQTFIVLLKAYLKPGRRLLVIVTTHISRNILHELQLLSSFNDIINVPSISTVESLINILNELKPTNQQQELPYFTDKQILDIEEKASKMNKIHIGVKRLVSLVELVTEADENIDVDKFISMLENID